MKIRLGFVTNSSSSSFVVLYEIDKVDLDFVKYIAKEEYGNQGVRRLDQWIIPGTLYEIPEEAKYSIDRDSIPIEADKFYLEATTWAGDECGSDEGFEVRNMFPREALKTLAEWGDDC